MAIAAWLTAAVIILAIILFVTEVVTVDLAALIVMSLLLVLGLVGIEEGLAGFSSKATITILALFILSEGIERTGFITLLAQRLSSLAGSNEFVMLVLLLGIAAPVSAFINNTAVVAIMLPLAVGLARDNGTAPSRVLIPLSFASMMGGMVTLIGTSTNILAAEIASNAGYASFTLFEFAAPAAILGLVGTAYLLTVGRWLTPDRGLAREERYNVQSYLGEVLVPKDSVLAGRTISELRLPDRYGVEVVSLSRDDELVETDPSTIIQPGDALLLLGRREDLLTLVSLERLKYRFADDARASPKDDVKFYEVLVTPQSRLVGRTIKSSRFRERYGGTVVAVRKGARVLHSHTPIARAHLDVGDALLIAGTPDDRRTLEQYNDLILVEELPGRKFRRDKMWLAVAILAGVVGTAALGVADILVTAIVGAVLMPILGVLDMEEFHRAIRWDILFLLAGLIPLGTAMQKSGLASAIATGIIDLSGALTPYAILVIIYATTTVLTEVMSNNATAVLLVPVAGAIGMSLGMNTEVFVLAVMFAASTSFLTPIGYQTNTLIYGPGGYRFTDYARVGLPLNVLFTLLAPWLLLQFFPV